MLTISCKDNLISRYIQEREITDQPHRRQSLIQQRPFSLKQDSRILMLAYHIHLAQRLRISGAITPPLHIPLGRTQWQPDLYFDKCVLKSCSFHPVIEYGGCREVVRQVKSVYGTKWAVLWDTIERRPCTGELASWINIDVIKLTIAYVA
jgi:hypothetical protein